MTCIGCGKPARFVFVAGSFPTGVVAPDGYREMRNEEFMESTCCGMRIDIGDYEALLKDSGDE